MSAHWARIRRPSKKEVADAPTYSDYSSESTRSPSGKENSESGKSSSFSGETSNGYIESDRGARLALLHQRKMDAALLRHGALRQPESTEVARLTRLVHEERASKMRMRAEYEQQIAALRHAIKIGPEALDVEERKRVLEQLEAAIGEYHTLAAEAVEMAKGERARVAREKTRVREIAENACADFERTMKLKLQKAVAAYRAVAVETAERAKREKEELMAKYVDFEKAVEEQQRQHAASVAAEAERRLVDYKKKADGADRVLREITEKYQAALNSLCTQVEAMARRFERSTIAKTLQVVWEAGVDIDEDTLMQRLARAEGVPLKSQMQELADQVVKDHEENAVYIIPETKGFGFAPVSEFKFAARENAPG